MLASSYVNLLRQNVREKDTDRDDLVTGQRMSVPGESPRGGLRGTSRCGSNPLFPLQGALEQNSGSQLMAVRYTETTSIR